MKYYTIQNPPPNCAEKFVKPSMTRESDYVSIEDIFARYGMDANLNPVCYRSIDQLSPDERDILENSESLADLENEDILVQKQFIDSTMEKVASLSKKEPTPAKEPEPEKPATEPENASK